MPLVSTKHTSTIHTAKQTVTAMQSRFLSAVCVVVVARQAPENIHNPHIVGSQDITNNQQAAALTPAESEMVTVGSD